MEMEFSNRTNESTLTTTYSQKTGPIVHCWACGAAIEVPHIKGSLATQFKCGWCLAISTLRSDLQPPTSPRTPSPYGRLYECLACVLYATTVTIVTLLLLSVIFVGYAAVLPQMFASHSFMLMLHQSFAGFMAFNVLFNFCAAAVRSPGVLNGSLPEASDLDGRVPAGCYDNFRFCVICQKVKPPGAHHCRVCRRCILDMDHHCPFIGNCVGKHNLRNFMLFLAYTAIGACYAAIMSLVLITQHWTEYSHQMHGGAFNMYGLLFTNLDRVPLWYIGSGYLFVLSFSGCIGVGLLLVSQLQQILRGQSYIQTLKGVPVDQNASMYIRFQQVFGTSSAVMWAMPYWGVPGMMNVEPEQAVRKAF